MNTGKDTTCERCGGTVVPTGGRSRAGVDAGASVAWQAWRETGVCTTCGAVHRRTLGLADAAWSATGMLAHALAPAVEVDTAMPFSVSKNVVIAAPPAVVTASAPPPVVATANSSLPAVQATAEGTVTAPSTTFDGMDYAMLGVVLTVMFGVAALTKDPGDTALAVLMLYAVLTWDPTCAALLRLLRDMQGRD